jgi:phage terminase small subunit
MAQQRQTVVRQRTHPPAESKKKLPKHMMVSPELARRFAGEYLFDHNATKAYMRAHLSCTNKQTAAVQGSRLLRNPKVRALVDAGERRILDHVERNAATLVQVMWDRVLFDPANLFDERGTLLPIHQIPIEVRRCLTGIEVARANLDTADGKRSPEWLHKVKFGDSTKNAEMLGKHYKLFDRAGETDASDVEQFVARINRARQRLADEKKRRGHRDSS